MAISVPLATRLTSYLSNNDAAATMGSCDLDALGYLAFVSFQL